MRVFQPVDPEEIESGAYSFGGGKMLITSSDGKKINTTAASFGGIGHMWGKRVVFICVRENRYTRELLDSSGEFSISFMDNKEYHGAMKYLEMVSGKDEDKLKGARLNICYHEGIPFIEESSNVLICKVIYKNIIDKDGFVDDSIPKEFYKDGNYHIIYVGELMKVLIR